MQIVDAKFVSGKKVLLRYDIDVALGKFEIRNSKFEIKVAEDFKLKAGLETLKLCLENASKVIIIGHLGRPFATAEDEKNGNPADLSAKPIQEWLEQHLERGLIAQGGVARIDFAKTLEEANQSTSKIVLLENIRFFHGEVPGAEYHATCISKTCDVDFASHLASLGEVYVNEAFSAHNIAASTTMVPTLLPHAAGLHFVKEVETLLNVRNNPKKPFVAIMGGAKVKDKLPVINVLAQKADAVLVGGKLVHEIREENVQVPSNVMVGKLNEDGFDIAPETTESWAALINKAAMIVWNGPLGKFEEEKYGQSAKIAQIVLGAGAEIVAGGGDTVSLLGSLGLLGKYQQKGFVSVGGGAMLKLISDGTLSTIEALNNTS